MYAAAAAANLGLGECGCPADGLRRSTRNTRSDEACHSHAGLGCDHEALAPYGEDSPEGWAATGPLIERFRLTLSYRYVEGKAWATARGLWHSQTYSGEKHGWLHGDGASPCEAACNLILALADAGRLAEKD